MKNSSIADFLNDMAVQFQSEGRSKEALDAFQRATEAYRSISDRQGEARCLNGVGAVLKDLGEYQEALDYLEQTLPLRRQTGDRRGEAITLLTLGPVYQRIGRYHLAEKSLVEALRMTRELGDRQAEGEALYNLGVVAGNAGQLERAYGLLQNALVIARQQQNMVEFRKCLDTLGTICLSLGNREEGLSLCYMSLQIAEATGNLQAQAHVLHNIGALLMETDKEEEARNCFERAVEIDTRTGSQAHAATTMTNLAAAYVNYDLERARDYADSSLSIAKEVGNQILESEALCAVAQILLKQSKYQEALRVLADALELAYKLDTPRLESNILCLIGLANYSAGKHEAAFSKYEEAITLLDQLYNDIGTVDFRLSFFSQLSSQNPYLLCISDLITYGEKVSTGTYDARAFYVNERRLARGLRELISTRFGGNGSATVKDEDNGWRRGEIGARLENIQALQLTEAQARLLDEDTALLEYSMHRGVAYVWALTCTDHVVVSLPCGGTEIRERVARLRDDLSARSVSFAEVAHELYTLLVEPIEHWIQDKKNLLVVPDDVLHLLPFQVLLTEPPHLFTNQADFPYLVRKHAITYAPSAAIFEVLDAAGPLRSPEQKDLIAFAPVEFPSGNVDRPQFAPLPASIDEVRDIGALFKEDHKIVKTFEAANKLAVVREQLCDFRFVHFATHAIFDDADPHGSGIVLRAEPDTNALLQTTELANLKLNADLVVLSACKTAMGTLKPGEGVLGLVRASICAGARSVCASMWEVEDTATSTLMISLYDNLVTKGLSKTEALQTSQLQLIREGRWSSPWFWGAFVLAGAWK